MPEGGRNKLRNAGMGSIVSRSMPMSSPRARVQAISGLVFAVFALPHVVNVMASALGPGRYDEFQTQIRPIYQFPLVEAVLLTALLVHVTAGVRRWWTRPRSKDPRQIPLRTRLHRATAYFLTLSIVGHVAATRGPGWFAGLNLGFAGLALAMDALPWFFYPYYVLLGCSGLYHASHGTWLALRMLGVDMPVRFNISWWVPLSASAILILLGVLSFGGRLYPIEDPWNTPIARFGLELGVLTPPNTP